MRRLILMLGTLGVVAALPAHAQTASIDPGMTRVQVIERLGTPAGERQSGTYTYLFYRNGCEIRCGMQDLVILQSDAVVDAIFRSTRRTFNGASSSPMGVTPEASGAGRATGGGTVNISPLSGAAAPSTSQPSGGGIVTGTPAAAPAPATQQPSSGAGVVTGVTTRPAAPATSPAATGANPMTAGPTTGGARPANTTVAPLSPRDTSNVQPSRTTQGQLTPATRDAQPIPFTGSKPNPRDSAEKARAGQKPDSTKPPED